MHIIGSIADKIGGKIRMIRYERLETSEKGHPNPVKVITDDTATEMMVLEDIVEEGEFVDIKLPKERDEDGNFSFIIPGAIVGEFAEYVRDIDDGELDELCDEWNKQAFDNYFSDK